MLKALHPRDNSADYDCLEKKEEDKSMALKTV